MKRKAKLEQIDENKPASPVNVGASSIVESASASALPNDAENSTLPEVNYFEKEELMNWVNFDVVETKKLEWMRDMPTNLPELKPGESYEARQVDFV